MYRQYTYDMWLMLLEDDVDLARILARDITRRTHWKVRTAHQVERLLEAIDEAAFPPHAIVLDFDLSAHHDGVDALVALRERGCEAPCAFYTSSERKRIESRLSATGRSERPPQFRKGQDLERLIAWLQSLTSNPRTSDAVADSLRD